MPATTPKPTLIRRALRGIKDAFLTVRKGIARFLIYLAGRMQALHHWAARQLEKLSHAEHGIGNVVGIAALLLVALKLVLVVLPEKGHGEDPAWMVEAEHVMGYAHWLTGLVVVLFAMNWLLARVGDPLAWMVRFGWMERWAFGRQAVRAGSGAPRVQDVSDLGTAAFGWNTRRIYKQRIEMFSAWSKANANAIRAIDSSVDGTVVGYTCALPLTEYVATAHLEGRSSQFFIRPGDIEPTTSMFIYINAVYLKDGYRGAHNRDVLLSVLYEQIAAMTDPRAPKLTVYAESFTPAGRKILRSQGFVRQKERSFDHKPIYVLRLHDAGASSTEAAIRLDKARKVGNTGAAATVQQVGEAPAQTWPIAVPPEAKDD